MAEMAAYLWSRRHWSFGDVSLMSMRQDEHGHAADKGDATALDAPGRGARG